MIFLQTRRHISIFSNSGKSPGKKVTLQGINNQQLADTPQIEHSTEDSLQFDRDMEALGESTHPTKDKVFVMYIITIHILTITTLEIIRRQKESNDIIKKPGR